MTRFASKVKIRLVDATPPKRVSARKMKSNKSRKSTSGYTRLDKRGYTYRDGKTLTVVPFSTLKKEPALRAALGITDQQWKQLNKLKDGNP